MADKQLEDSLIYNIKTNNCSESFLKLLDLDQDLYFNVCHKFCDKHKDADRQGLLEDVMIVFNRAINSYNPNKSKGCKFSSWLNIISRFYCLDSIYKKNNRLKSKTTSYASDELNEISNYHSHACAREWDNRGELIEKVLLILDSLEDKRISQVFRIRYLEKDKKLNWKEVSKKMGLSGNLCANLHEKGANLLRAKLKGNLNL